MKKLIIPAGTEAVTVVEIIRLMRSTANEVGIRLYMDGNRKIIGRTQGGMVDASELLTHFLEFCKHKNVVPISPIAPWRLDYTGLDVQNRMYAISIDEFRMFALPYGIEILCEGMAATSPPDSVMRDDDEPPDSEWGADTLNSAGSKNGVLNRFSKPRGRRVSPKTGLGGIFVHTPNIVVEENAASLSASIHEQTSLTNPSSDHDAELAGLFDPVKVAQLERMFPSPNKKGQGKWAGWAEHAGRNGLGSTARVSRALFNPYRAAMWWLNRGPKDWDWARCIRVLVNNLPHRSTDSKHLLCGNGD